MKGSVINLIALIGSAFIVLFLAITIVCVGMTYITELEVFLISLVAFTLLIIVTSKG